MSKRPAGRSFERGLATEGVAEIIVVGEITR